MRENRSEPDVCLPGTTVEGSKIIRPSQVATRASGDESHELRQTREDGLSMRGVFLEPCDQDQRRDEKHADTESSSLEELSSRHWLRSAREQLAVTLPVAF